MQRKFIHNMSYSIILSKIALGVALIIAGAQIYIPLHPVPITFQSLAAIFMGLTLRPKEALATTLLYVIMGCLGMPVFSGFMADPLRVFGPTGGYLIGCIAAAYLVAKLKEDIGNDSFLKFFTLTMIGSVVIFIAGIIRLSFFIGFKEAISNGLIPFIIPGIVKCLILSVMLKIWNRNPAN